MPCLAFAIARATDCQRENGWEMLVATVRQIIRVTKNNADERQHFIQQHFAARHCGRIRDVNEIAQDTPQRFASQCLRKPAVESLKLSQALHCRRDDCTRFGGLQTLLAHIEDSDKLLDERILDCRDWEI